uniref:Uncharacterized protein n=1 Tax=Arundo donax TaxID=35708 RepID=A0A0A9B3J8_ARUDO
MNRSSVCTSRRHTSTHRTPIHMQGRTRSRRRNDECRHGTEQVQH